MYLIVGANGFLGSYLLKSVLDKTNEKIIAVSRDIKKPFLTDSRVEWISVDIENLNEVETLCKKINEQKEPIKVLFLAAFHHPDKVAKDPKKAWGINITSLALFLGKANNVNCLFYPSTDSVYGDSIDGYAFKETDDLNPVNVYGGQKVLAERLVVAAGYNVLRYPFLIGESLLPHKKHFYDIMTSELLLGNEFELFSDSYRSTLSFKQCADLTIELVERFGGQAPKILNVCGDKMLSKFDVGVELAKKLGVSERLLKPISVKQGGEIFETKRADSTVMDNSLLKKTVGAEKILLEI